MRGGFLHIPYVPEQAARLGGAPSMALDDIVRGIEIVLAVSAARTSTSTPSRDGSPSGSWMTGGAPLRWRVMVFRTAGAARS